MEKWLNKSNYIKEKKSPKGIHYSYIKMIKNVSHKKQVEKVVNVCVCVTYIGLARHMLYEFGAVDVLQRTQHDQW